MKLLLLHRPDNSWLDKNNVFASSENYTTLLMMMKKKPVGYKEKKFLVHLLIPLCIKYICFNFE